MNPRLVKLLSVIALILSAPALAPAGAQPSQTPVEGQFTGRPSCAAGVQNPINPHSCVARGDNNVLFGFRFDHYGGLYSPKSLGMTTVRNAACAQETSSSDEFYDGTITVCAMVGADNALYGFGISYGGLDTPVRNLGGTIAGDPSCVLTNDGFDRAGAFATCAAVDANNRLVAIRFNPLTGVSSGWQILGGTVVDNPSCVPAREGFLQVVCGVKGSDNSLFGIRFAPQSGYTSGFRSLGGKFVGSPSCANSGSGTATCAARNAENELVGIRFNPNNNTKSPLQNVGGTWVGDPSCAPANQGLNRVVCVGRATDNSLEAIRLNPTTGFSSGFQGIPGNFASDASCVHTPNPVEYDRGVFCAARGMNNALSLFYVNP